MKANSRRRVLISSMAMLLVALVALSTATYAWFTTSANANASGINVSTTKSSKLLIAKSDFAFSPSITYFTGTKVLRPATSVDGENWYKNAAAASDSYVAGGEFTSANADLGNYVYVDMLNIKNEGETDINGVNVTVTTGAMSEFARIAIVPCTAQADAVNIPTVTADAFKANIYGASKDRTWEPMNGNTGDDSDNFSTKDVANNAVIDAGNFTAGQVKSYKIFVWFEGQDALCYDATSATFNAPEIKFAVAGTAVQ